MRQMPLKSLYGFFMKFILMSATLYSLAGPVLAGQNNGHDECLNMYRTYLSTFESIESESSKFPAEKQEIYFSKPCLPDSADDEGAQYKKLLRLRPIDKRVFTIEAHLVEHNFVEQDFIAAND